MTEVSAPGKVLIRQADIISGKDLKRTDILLADGRISRIGEKINEPDISEIIEAEGLLATYGLADVHVSVREHQRAHTLPVTLPLQLFR